MDRVDYQPLLVQDILSWHDNDQLELNPWYQRRSVWTIPQKAYLLNTILESKPVPTLYFRHAIDLRKNLATREVVDGQQRIRSILEFVENKFSVRHPRHEKKVAYDDLTAMEKRNFRSTQLSGGNLLGASESDVIEIFGRLNSVAKTLNAQEKRNADYSGEFKQFCLQEASKRVAIWKDLGLFSANDIARMAEVQFVSDLVLNLLNGLSDYSAANLGKIYKQYDEEFKQWKKTATRLNRCFQLITSIKEAAIRDTIFKRTPLFFSLVFVLDSLSKKPTVKKLEKVLFDIDSKFNADKPVNERSTIDAEFHAACTASTQRIKSRRVRDKYIRKHV